MIEGMVCTALAPFVILGLAIYYLVEYLRAKK